MKQPRKRKARKGRDPAKCYKCCKPVWIHAGEKYEAATGDELHEPNCWYTLNEHGELLLKDKR